MSISYGDRVEAAIYPYLDLDELIKDLHKKKPKAEALKAAANALELMKELFESHA